MWDSRGGNDQRYRSRVNNAQGHLFEQMVEKAAESYRLRHQADIRKIPEPFRTLRNIDRQKGLATVRFIGHAYPDYMGVLDGGRAIAFEAKYTSNNRIRRNVVTDTQAECLEYYYQLGGVAGVCCGIGLGYDIKYYFVPWEFWRDMNDILGRAYATQNDLKRFEVEHDMAIWFLNYKKDSGKRKSFRGDD